MTTKLFFLAAIVASAVAIKLELIKSEYINLGTKVNFYDEDYQNGMSTFVETQDGGCKNLQRRWQKRAVSMDLRGTCASLCTEVDCRGTCVVAIPGKGEQNLGDIGMTRKVASVQGCFVEGSQKKA